MPDGVVRRQLVFLLRYQVP